tara:strand:- start:646 stop:816 length:171 start_codon:yes stop_codon:yes gene_type:complete
MSNIEDVLYEAMELGIHRKVINRMNKLQKKNPHGHLNSLYDEALRIEKNKLKNKKK